MGYKEDLEIDKYALDSEIVRQAQLFIEWSENWAQAMFEKDKLKERLDIAMAEADALVRSDPEKYGWPIKGKAPTESFIKKATMMMEGLSTQNSEYIEKCKEVNILAAAKEAFNHKRSALEMLVKLFLGGYYAEVPLVSKEKTEVAGKVQDEIRDKLETDPKLVRIKRNK